MAGVPVDAQAVRPTANRRILARRLRVQGGDLKVPRMRNFDYWQAAPRADAKPARSLASMLAPCSL